MDARVSRITRELRNFDRRLFAHRRADGMIQIIRQADRLEASNYLQDDPELTPLHPQFIIALTDNWNTTGKPVEWGIEPIMNQLKSMDSWRNTRILDQLREKREREARDKERTQRNELRAQALDMRRDFARATNGINTSTLAKVDNRRKADGYRK